VSDEPDEEAAARGRPRDPAVDEAILGAARQLLLSGGLGALTMEGVAQAAGVAKTTVYRRWPTREDLAAAAVDAVRPSFELPDLGDLRTELATIGPMVDEMAANPAAGHLMAMMLHAVAERGPLGDHYWTHYIDHRRVELAAAIQRAIDRGDLAPDADLEVLADIIAGTAVYLSLKPGDEAFSARWERALPTLLAAVGVEVRPD
jgi:AcrR family transcriptional regulator